MSLSTGFDTTPLKQYSICICYRVLGLTDIKLLQLRWRALTDYICTSAECRLPIKTGEKKKDPTLCPSYFFFSFDVLSKLVLFFIVTLFRRHDNRNSGALNNEQWLHSRLFDLSSSK